MDTALVLLSTSLVGYKIMKYREKEAAEIGPELNPIVEEVQTYRPLGEARTREDFSHFQGAATPPPEQSQLEPPQEAPPRPSNIPDFLLRTRPPTMSLPQVAEIPSVRLPASQDDGGMKKFNEQFFPQDSKSTGTAVVTTPWMRAIQAAQNTPPRTEREAAHPSKETDRDDIRGRNIPALLRERDNLDAKTNLSRFKTFESPVDQEWTGNGEKRGLHPIKRYHKFLLSDQPVVELPEGPRGAFASGANKSSLAKELDNNKREVHVEHTGIPCASFGVGMPESSFELGASNAEHWDIDKHVASASRAPVESGGTAVHIKESFTLAHDESLDVLAVTENSNLSKARVPRSEASAVRDLSTRERGIPTPSVVGAPGGVTTKHTDKSSEFKSTAQKENLAASAQRVSMASGIKASKPSAASSSADHEHAGDRFAEEETGARVRGAPHLRKAAEVSRFSAASIDNQFSLGNAKDTINGTPFTSKNFAAPRNKSMPALLSVAPTASLSLSARDVSLKASEGMADMLSMGRNKGVVSVKTSNLTEKKPEQNEKKLRTIVMDRANRGVVVANPYSTPRPFISEK